MAQRIERLALAIAAANEGAYVSGSLDAQTLAERYEAIDPAQAWANFSGPCYRRKGTEEGAARSAPERRNFGQSQKQGAQSDNREKQMA